MLRSFDWQRYAPYAFLAVAVFAIYSNIYDNVFLFDDDLLIRLNTYLRSWNTFDKLFTASTTEGAHIAGGFYRPIQNILYFIIFQIGGEKPFGFHLLNISLHAANACLGYRLALRLSLDARASLLAMLIWALHPLHTEAVTYMSGTADPLFVFFCLWGLNVLFPKPTAEGIWFSVPLFVLAILCKETAVVFPALVCVCMWFVQVQQEETVPSSTAKQKYEAKKIQQKNVAAPDFQTRILSLAGKIWQDYRITWPLWLFALAYLAWRVTSTDFDGPERYAILFKMPEYSQLKFYSSDHFVRIFTFFATLPAYAGLLLWPVDLHMERAFPMFLDFFTWQVLEGVAFVTAALAQIIFDKSPNNRALSWGLLWFGAAHAPNSGIFFSMNSLFLEHWMYMPTIGLFLGLGHFITVHLKRFKDPAIYYTVLGLVLVVITGLSARTYDQNTIWREPIVFYTNIFSHGASSARAHNNLAIAYMNHRELQKAIAEYRKAIAQGDTYAETHFNLALALLSMPDQKEELPKAIAELQRSLEIEPGFYRSYQALGEIYSATGDLNKATYYQQKAKELLGN